MLVGIVGSIFVLQQPDTQIVEIVQDGEVLYQFDFFRCMLIWMTVGTM